MHPGDIVVKQAGWYAQDPWFDSYFYVRQKNCTFQLHTKYRPGLTQNILVNVFQFKVQTSLYSVVTCAALVHTILL